MAEGVDYAYTAVDEVRLYAAGKRFAGRYIGLGGAAKLLTAAERDRLHAAGLDIMLLVEGAADSALGGYDKGAEFGRRAQAHAKSLGAPADCVFYLAVDFDATSTQWPIVASHLKGFASVVTLARTGVYGGIRTMQWAARDKVATHFFQTYAWSHGDWYAGNDVEQYHNGVALAGGTVDLCRSKRDDFGQWRSDMASLADDPWGRALCERVYQGMVLMKPVIEYQIPGEAKPRVEPNGLAAALKSLGLSDEQLKAIGAAAFAGAQAGDDGASAEEVKAIIDAAVAPLPQATADATIREIAN